MNIYDLSCFDVLFFINTSFGKIIFGLILDLKCINKWKKKTVQVLNILYKRQFMTPKKKKKTSEDVIPAFVVSVYNIVNQHTGFFFQFMYIAY